MDKLLLSLSFVVLLASLTVNSAPMPSSKLMSSIDQRHKQYTHSGTDNAAAAAIAANDDDDESIKLENAESVRMQKINQMRKYDERDDAALDAAAAADDDNDSRRGTFIRRRNDMLGETGLRQHKMIGFYPFNAPPFGYPSYALYPSEFYDDFASFYGGGLGEEEEIMSRTIPGSRRRPAGGSYKNSPIYYIRLPPTPYMFVPGLGYISQPPSYTPMAPVPQPISPFYNLPLDFISNGKPTNIYQWGSPAGQFNPQQQYQQPPPQYQQSQYQRPQFDSYPSYHQRPQRPSYTQRPSYNPYVQESKVTNLKGQFLFNGRPEEIFVLPNQYNSYNSIYPRLSAAYY